MVIIKNDDKNEDFLEWSSQPFSILVVKNFIKELIPAVKDAISELTPVIKNFILEISPAVKDVISELTPVIKAFIDEIAPTVKELIKDIIKETIDEIFKLKSESIRLYNIDVYFKVELILTN